MDLLGGEDGGVRPGVALACLTRLGTSALKKLCRKRVLQRAGADEASASLASLAFTEKRTEGVEHTALLSLWRHFRLADGDRLADFCPAEVRGARDRTGPALAREVSGLVVDVGANHGEDALHRVRFE